MSILTKTLISLQQDLKNLYSLDLVGNPVCDLENYTEKVFEMMPSLEVSLLNTISHKIYRFLMVSIKKETRSTASSMVTNLTERKVKKKLRNKSLQISPRSRRLKCRNKA